MLKSLLQRVNRRTAGLQSIRCGYSSFNNNNPHEVEKGSQDFSQRDARKRMLMIGSVWPEVSVNVRSEPPCPTESFWPFFLSFFLSFSPTERQQCSRGEELAAGTSPGGQLLASSLLLPSQAKHFHYEVGWYLYLIASQ